MADKIAGIDIHKKMIAVAIADVEVAETWQFERQQMGTTPNQLRALAEWLVEREVDEVVMESTAQYWRPVWEALERGWQPRRQQPGKPSAGALHLAQAPSNEGRRGRKRDLPDAERLVKRLVPQELTFKLRAGRDAAAVAHRRAPQVPIDLQAGAAAEPRGVSARGDAPHALESRRRSDWAQRPPMLRAIANGATDPAAVVALGSRRLHATPEQLRDALGACTDLHPVYRRLLALTLDELEVIEHHLHALDAELAQ